MKTITIAKGDYGFSKTINITSSIITTGDTLLFVIKKGDTRVITKSFTASPTNNVTTINVTLTEEDTNKLDVGYYQWGIEHSKTGAKEDLPIEKKFYADFIVEEGI